MDAGTFFLTEYYDFEDDETRVAKNNYTLQELYHFAEAYHKFSERQTTIDQSDTHESKELHIADVSNSLIAFAEWIKKDSKGYFEIPETKIEEYLRRNL